MTTTNLIKIKRSSSNATLGSASPQLSNGELAWTEAGNVLFIGAYGGGNNFAIAGQRVPGTLTANQAIVTNSTNMVDQIMLGNSTVNSVANGTVHQFQNSTVVSIYGTFGANVGANVYVTTSQLFIGNSTVNVVVNSSTLAINTYPLAALFQQSVFGAI